MTRHVAASGDSALDVRQYRPSDRADVVSLYERLVGGDGSAWFSWKYEDNPYLDHVPMAVATADGRVVAATPAVAFELRVGTHELRALQVTDRLAHPDYQTQAIRTRTTRHLQSIYADRDPALFFDVAVRDSPPTDGFRTVTKLPTAYRVHSYRAFAGDDAGHRARALARFLGPLERLSDRLREATPTAEHVTRSNHVPVRTLTGLARAHQPGAIHAVRDPQYLAWRFGNPEWSYTTYLTGETGARAAAVVGQRRVDSTRVVGLTDVYPPAVEDRCDAVERLLGAVVADSPRADWIVADATVLPRRIRRRTGFRRDDSPPLSWLRSSVSLFACPATGPEPTATDWVVGGRDLRNPESWHLSLAERDGW